MVLHDSNMSPFLTHPEVAWSSSKLAGLYHQKEAHLQGTGSQKCPRTFLFHQAGEEKSMKVTWQAGFFHTAQDSS